MPLPAPPPPAFTAASTLPRPTEPSKPPTTLTSNRNASNAHLPVPSAPPITLDGEPDGPPPSTAAALGQDGKAAPKPGVNVNGVEGASGKEKTTGSGAGMKPVNVPSGSKRSIVVNARQVSCYAVRGFYEGLIRVERESGFEGYSRRWMGIWGYRTGLSSRREYVCFILEVSLRCGGVFKDADSVVVSNTIDYIPSTCIRESKPFGGCTCCVYCFLCVISYVVQ